MEIYIKKLKEHAILPSYKSKQAAGMDLYACLESPIILKPKDIKLIPTGIALEIPKEFEGQIRSRSGLALKHGIIVLNSPGTIDSDYRGEIGIILQNNGDRNFEINSGDRIAQLIINKIETVQIQQVLYLSETERGNNGFGSTGMNIE